MTLREAKENDAMFSPSCCMSCPFMLIVLIKTANTDCHSLWVLATYISGETQFPKFSAVLMVDDVQVEYYDSKDGEIISRRHWKSGDVVEEADLKNMVISMIRDHLHVYFQQLQSHFNDSGGVHTYQRITGCEMNDEGESPLMLWDAYDGITTRSYNKVVYMHNPLLPELMWSKLKIEASKLVNANLYQPLCIRTLKNYLKQEKNAVMRKVRPRVRVFQKTRPESGVRQVCCLATGFYPRHINITLLRDGHSIPEEQLLTGELLPNGDGTYQQRKILDIGAEERKERHIYTCTVTHTSLSNKLDITWEPASAPDLTLLAVAASVVVSMTAGLVVAVAALIKWKKRSAGQQGYLQPSDSTPVGKENNSTSSTSSF